MNEQLTNLPLQPRENDLGGWEINFLRHTMYWSENLYRILGVDKSDFVPDFNNCLQLIHPEDRPLVLAAIKETAAKKQSVDVEFRIVRPSGEIRTIHARGDIIFGERRNIRRIIGAVQDITERRIEQQKLLEINALYQLVVENAQDIISYSDSDGILVFVSPSVFNLLGYTPEELIGKKQVGLLHPDDVPALLGQKFDDVDVVEYRALHKNGTFIWVESKFKLIRDAFGKPEKTLGITRDMTSKKMAEEQMIRAEKLSMAGQLAAGIAHEIRNPLAAIKGFCKLIETTGAKKGYFEIIQSEFDRIETIITELLLLAKPNTLQFKQHDLVFIMQQVISLLESQANLHNVSISTRYDACGLYMLCDDNQIKQVFINIVKNAIEAMPAGGNLTIDIRKDGREAIVRISDQGCGIPPEVIDKIGQPFYSTKEKGTGLGLMMCLSIVENHKGKLSIESRPGEGSTFAIRLPIHA